MLERTKFRCHIERDRLPPAAFAQGRADISITSGNRAESFYPIQLFSLPLEYAYRILHIVEKHTTWPSQLSAYQPYSDCI